ncbi:MAG: Jag N-terminal domain-containing protein, partial [Erysipelotrichaceae bacterium]|nr:Jag N-terminal domain-containing protein [Erysipelotrichaceae bacterium]
MKKYEAKNLELVLQKAAEDRKVPQEELVYYVLEEKKDGFLGFGNKAVIEAFIIDDVSDFIHNYLKKFFDGIGLETEITVKRKEGFNFEVNLSSKNNAIMIGKAGLTLQSLTTVLKASTNAEFKRKINVSIDINGYKENRFEKLEQMVDRIARTVVKTKVSARLGAMTNEERKVVHQYLSNFTHVKTESEGEGANRRLKIIYDDGSEGYIAMTDESVTLKAPKMNTVNTKN